MDFFISTLLKMFFIMTPFFVLSVFLTITNEATPSEKRKLAVKVTFSVVIISLVLLFFGQHIFKVFGITLEAFKIGAGALLFLTAVGLIYGNKDGQQPTDKNLSDLAVVPLALPITIGPGTIGVLLVIGAEFDSFSKLIMGSLALICAIFLIGTMLYLSSLIEKFIGKEGLLIISKITGLFLAALSAQIMFDGIKSFLGI
ncbi:MarC family protein [Aliarcobacter lanthieri]|uniref:MarC family protein n=1 Tax=Aliarcobacter lanthieri TaxID=1355374 RepID=UPI00047C1D2F|nr:MarC family protein [Aliarcobacter lanthieri]QKF58635.1 MarC family membrane protein [Aliarcobacter lanthieri]